MARDIGSKIRIEGTLKALAPFCVGGRAFGAEVDLPWARDGRGRLYLPGTGLAGPLREWVRSAYDDDLAQKLFGFQDGGHGEASRTFIEDSVLENVADDCVELRDGVGIDRIFGSAAKGFKYDRAVLARNTLIPFRMSIELPLDVAKASRLAGCVGHMLFGLRKGEVGFGAARTRGLGSMMLTEDLTIREEDWSTPSGVIRFLRSDLTSLSLADLMGRGSGPNARACLSVSVKWKPKSPVMVKASQDGMVVDMLPLVTGAGADQYVLVIPGSSIKGTLRSHAEKIVRTLLHIEVSPGSKLHDQIRVPLIEDVFGSGKLAAPKIDDEISSSPAGAGYRPGRGILFVNDCCGQATFDLNTWNSIQSARDEESLRAALDSAGLQKTQHAFHNAVDRWLGGAADRFLFSGLEPMEHEWDRIELMLDLTRLAHPDHRNRALALLLVLIRDLFDGNVPIGFGSNRGMGWVEIEEVTLKGDALGAILPQFNEPGVTARSFPELLARMDGALGSIQNAWTSWLDANPVDSMMGGQ